MSAFSYSAEYYTKEDEKREVDQLTYNEKELILDDVYGRRRKEGKGEEQQNLNGDRQQQLDEEESELNNNSNEYNDLISDQLLDEFERALEAQPFELSDNYWYAWLNHEDLVNSESDPEWFIKCENYDVDRAALRICEYWNMRVHAFGTDHAFKPMSLKDNEGLKDVLSYFVAIPTLGRILPNDDVGRPVLCWDRTGMPISYKDHDYKIDLKIMIYLNVIIMQQYIQDASEDIVVLHINKTCKFWDLPSRKLSKYGMKLSCECLPVKICCHHQITNSVVASCVIPLLKYLMPKKNRLRMQVHSAGLKNQTLLKELSSFGLQSENLPTSIGGKYNEIPFWIDECEQILQEESKKKRRFNQDRRER